MYSFNSKETIESATYPGVKFTVRILNDIQRARRDAKLLDVRARINELQDRWAVAKDKGDGAIELLKINDEAALLSQSQLKPAYIRAGLVSVEGIEIDGVPATVETLIESGPVELVNEIYDACVKASGLGAEETKNSQSPGTSPEAEAGQESNTTAPAAAQ